MRDVAILVPGRLHEHAATRIGAEFRLERIASSDPALLDANLARAVRGIAAMTRIDAALIDALPALEIIANFGVGYDAVDAVHAAKKGVMVTNTPDVLTEEVADTTLGLLLNTVRELPKAETWLREGRWEREGGYRLSPLTLRGRKAGIFGMGRIGRAVARRLEAFGVEVEYHNRRQVPDLGYRWHATLLDLATSVDTLICIAPGGAATEKAVGSDVLRALGPDGVFISIGRGSTVDEPALIEALRSGAIAAAGLDVYADEPRVPAGLLALPNAVLLPHVGSASVYTRRAMADLCVDNLVNWFDKGAALTPVPETAEVKGRGQRLPSSRGEGGRAAGATG